MSKPKPRPKPTHRLLRWLLIVLLVGMPFHAFFTTWLGDMFDSRAIWQAWKDVLLLGAGIYVLSEFVRNRDVRRWLWSMHWSRLIFAYGVLHIIFLLLPDVEYLPAILSLEANLVFLVAFMVALYNQRFAPVSAQLLEKLIMIPALIVAAFATLQLFLLPDDFLAAFGYSGATIQPVLYIDNAKTIARFSSTLGGPNQLGIYLLIPLAIIGTKLLRGQWRWGWTLPLILLGLYTSHSRSAWLAALAMAGFLIWIQLSHQWRVRSIWLSFASLPFVAALGYWWASRSEFIRHVLLHNANNIDITQGSTTDRLRAQWAGIREFAMQPWGKGPGTAGPSSFEHTEPNVTENYFLQLAIEVGLVGLLVFIVLSWQISTGLWRQIKNHPLAAGLLVSFIGITISNLFLHSWADSTVAIIWWSAAGMVLSATPSKAK